VPPDADVSTNGNRGDGRPSTGPQYPITSVDNALRLLMMFRSQPVIRVSHAAVALEVANSTAHRLLAMLLHHGFVQQDAVTKGYRAGPALYDIGLAVVRRMDVRDLIRPFLAEVVEQTGETTHCAVLEGANVRFIDAVESPKAVRVAPRTGVVMPAHCTSVGKVLLAALSDDEINAIYPDETLVRTTDRSIGTRQELAAALAGVRKAGHAVNVEESEEGVSSVAVVVLDPFQWPVAAISCAAPVFRMNRRRAADVAKVVHDVADRLAVELGRPVPD